MTGSSLLQLFSFLTLEDWRNAACLTGALPPLTHPTNPPGMFGFHSAPQTAGPSCDVALLHGAPLGSIGSRSTTHKPRAEVCAPVLYAAQITQALLGMYAISSRCMLCKKTG